MIFLWFVLWSSLKYQNLGICHFRTFRNPFYSMSGCWHRICSPSPGIRILGISISGELDVARRDVYQWKAWPLGLWFEVFPSSHSIHLVFNFESVPNYVFTKYWKRSTIRFPQSRIVESVPNWVFTKYWKRSTIRFSQSRIVESVPN